jgi:3-oxoacyl-[acyl-carrier-protein] synthase II
VTNRRVAITGIGIVSPHGADAKEVLGALMEGKSAVRRLEIQSDVGMLETVGATISGEPWLDLPQGQRVASDRVGHYALLAANAAVRDAGIEFAREDLSRIGTSIGTCQGGVATEEAAYSDILRKNKPRLSPFTLVKVMYNGPAAQIALAYGLKGPSLTYTTTCSSSSVAIGEAGRQIRHGYADMIVAGGTEAPFTYVSMKAWSALHVLAPIREDNPAATCRPFSLDRNGTVLGEGAAFVVLEEYERAKRRGAQIYCELAGYGVCNDASHMTQPSIEGQSRAMQLALDDAKLPPSAIDYINAHGTGTPLNDLTETHAIKAVFGGHAQKLAVSSTKSMHGHLVGAAGALEFVLIVLALQRQLVPPTANLEVADPECDLDYVPNLGRESFVRAAMSNAFAVGGTAAVLVVGAARS